MHQTYKHGFKRWLWLQLEPQCTKMPQTHLKALLFLTVWSSLRKTSHCLCVFRWESAVGRLSVQRLGVRYRHGMKDLVQQLKSPVQVDFDPAGGLLDALPRVVRPPAFHKTHSENAQPSEVVDPNAGSCRETWGRGEGGVRDNSAGTVRNIDAPVKQRAANTFCLLHLAIEIN